MIKIAIWKWLCIFLVLYTIIGGMMMEVPRLPILNETIRNLYFHVPMWFGMIILLGASCGSAIGYLKNPSDTKDDRSYEWAKMGICLGVLGLITGMIWAKYTWGAYWSGDPKQNASAIGILIYLAYFVLRQSLEDEQRRARVSAVFNIFAYATLIPLLFILPRMTDSLHPGNGGNPGFNSYDLNASMRWVFYPAVVAWTMLGFWISNIGIRLKKLERNEKD